MSVIDRTRATNALRAEFAKPRPSVDALVEIMRPIVMDSLRRGETRSAIGGLIGELIADAMIDMSVDLTFTQMLSSVAKYEPYAIPAIEKLRSMYDKTISYN